MTGRRPWRTILPAAVLIVLAAASSGSAQIPSIVSNGSLGALNLLDGYYTIFFNTDAMTVDISTFHGGYSVGGGCPYGTYTGPGDPDGCARLVSQPGGPDIVVWDYTDVNVGTGFYVVGSRPAAVVATGTITVSGTIVAQNGHAGAASPVSGAGVAGTGPGGGGGGAGPGWYVTVNVGGYTGYDPLAGGGGGGGGGAGAGAKGGDSRTIIDINGIANMVPGGVAGAAYLGGIGPLLPGSGGGSGGDRPMWGGPATYGGAGGGNGGGTLILATPGNLVISGTVTAAGKPGGNSNDGGGGGGGGGGFLVLRVGGTLTIDAAGTIGAEGGIGGFGPGAQRIDSYGGTGGGGIVSVEAGTFAKLGAISVAGGNPGQVLFSLTINAKGPGSGTITSQVLPAINCSAAGGVVTGSCTQTYVSGTSVVLTATPAPGAAFFGWTGDADCADGIVTIGEPRHCTADFRQIPTVSTAAATAITASGATGGGNVALDGGMPVTSRGVCWGTTANPTVEASHTADGTGLGVFSSKLTGLAPVTSYHVRAYAANAVGIAYGSEVSFITPKGIATFVFGQLTFPYDGTPKPVTVTTSPPGLTGVTVTYNGSMTAPSNIGSYTVTASLSNATYEAANATATLVIVPPTPTVTAISPPRVRLAGGGFTLTVTGSSFLSNAGVLWNGTPRPTTIVNGTTLQAAIPASDVLQAGRVQVSVLNGTAASAPRILVVGDLGPDFDGDYKPDIVWHNRVTGEIIFWLMEGANTRREVRLAGPLHRNWFLAAVGDFNQDGKADLLWRNAASGEVQVWFMNGTAYAGTASIATVSDMSWRIAAAADFNGDGKTDILWRQMATGDIVVWYMNGPAYGGYARVSSIPDTAWTIVGADDFNGDGKTDILWRNKSTGRNLVWYLDGANYAGYAWLQTVADVSWRVASTGDFNGDGKADILWRNVSTGENQIAYLDDVTPIDSVSIQAVTDPDWNLLNCCDHAKASPADFNIDGSADILWHNGTTNETRIWYMSGAAKLPTDGVVDTDADTNWRTVATADFNHDGLPDIVWRHTGTGQNRIWLMTGAQHTGDLTLPTIADSNWKIVGVGDFNQDGHPDLAWRNYATGQNVIWFLWNGQYYDWTAPPTIADTNWKIVAVGDFNGDGWPDLFWRNSVTGVNIAWFLVKGVYAGWGQPPTIANTTWQIVGAADYNGDGKADLLWRNATTGQNLIWYLKDGTYLDWAPLPSLDIAWKTGVGQ